MRRSNCIRAIRVCYIASQPVSQSVNTAGSSLSEERTAIHPISRVVHKDTVEFDMVGVYNRQRPTTPLPLYPSIGIIDRYIPHLAAQKVNTLDNRVRQPAERQGMRPPRVIRRILLLLYPLVPVVAVPIESANAMPVYPDIIAAKNPCSRLVLVSHGQGVVEPVGDVGTPLPLPLSACQDPGVYISSIVNKPAVSLGYQHRHHESRKCSWRS